MIHLIYDATIYLNIDNAKTINVDTVENKLIITYRGSNKAVIDVASHPKVKELIDSYEEKERDSLKKYICFKVLELILKVLSEPDKQVSPIINLESVLNTIHKKSEEQEQEEKEMIPVTVDKDGNITNVIKENENDE